MIVQSNTPIETSNRGRKGVQVYLQDQTTRLLNLYFTNKIASLSLAVEPNIGDTDIVLSPGHGITVGNIGDTIEIASEVFGSRFMTPTILGVSGDTISLDQPIDFTYSTSSFVQHSSSEIAVDGSVTPVVFSLEPNILQQGDITRVVFVITDPNPMDFETFGGIASLTNGLLLRIKNPDNTFTNLYNFKNNGDLINVGFDHSFLTNNGNNTRGFTCRIIWSGQGNNGVVIRVEGHIHEELQLVVQDDLSTLGSLRLIGQGSEIQD